MQPKARTPTDVGLVYSLFLFIFIFIFFKGQRPCYFFKVKLTGQEEIRNCQVKDGPPNSLSIKQEAKA